MKIIRWILKHISPAHNDIWSGLTMWPDPHANPWETPKVIKGDNTVWKKK